MLSGNSRVGPPVLVRSGSMAREAFNKNPDCVRAPACGRPFTTTLILCASPLPPGLGGNDPKPQVEQRLLLALG